MELTPDVGARVGARIELFGRLQAAAVGWLALTFTAMTFAYPQDWLVAGLAWAMLAALLALVRAAARTRGPARVTLAVLDLVTVVPGVWLLGVSPMLPLLLLVVGQACLLVVLLQDSFRSAP